MLVVNAYHDGLHVIVFRGEVECVFCVHAGNGREYQRLATVLIHPISDTQRHQAAVNLTVDRGEHGNALSHLRVQLHLSAKGLHLDEANQVVQRVLEAEVAGGLIPLTIQQVLRLDFRPRLLKCFLCCRSQLTVLPLQERVLFGVSEIGLVQVADTSATQNLSEVLICIRCCGLTHGRTAGRAVLPAFGILLGELLTGVDVEQDLRRDRLVVLREADITQPGPVVQDLDLIIQLIQLGVLSRCQLLLTGEPFQVLLCGQLVLPANQLLVHRLSCIAIQLRFAGLLVSLDFVSALHHDVIDAVFQLGDISAQNRLIGVGVLNLKLVHLVEQTAESRPTAEDVAHRTRNRLSGFMGILVHDVYDLVLGQTAAQVHHGLAHRVDDGLRLHADGGEVHGSAVLRIGVLGVASEPTLLVDGSRITGTRLQRLETNRGAHRPQKVDVLGLQHHVVQVREELYLLSCLLFGNQVRVNSGLDNCAEG